MNDMISRQSAIDAITEIDDGINMDIYTNEVREILREVPSVQSQRMRGKWIRNDNGTYSCSVCQSWIPEEQHCYARYCLYCGAEMRNKK